MSYGSAYQPVDSYAQSFIGHPTDPNVGLPPGWIARWDQNSQHWYYVDTSTGRSQWERPILQQTSYAPPPQPPQPQQPLMAPQAGYYTGGGAVTSHSSDSGSHGAGAYDHHFDDKGYHKNWASHQATYTEPDHPKPTSSPKPPKKHSNWGKYAAVGAGALGLGVLGGAVMAHEGEELKDSVEGRYDNFKNDVEYAPENAAGWVGDKVGEAEGEYDNIKDDVENIPEDVAGWTGEQVGKVEQFGDNVGDAYDEGKDEGRYGDDNDGSSSSSDDNGDNDYADDGDDGGDYED